jgi:hypothetical protein
MRKILIGNAIVLAFGAVVSIATPGHAAVSSILECHLQSEPTSIYELYEIDYAASTVRTHYIDEGGNPVPLISGIGYSAQDYDITYPAEISDSQIKFETARASNVVKYEIIDRYSAKRTGVTWDRLNGYINGTLQCHPYVPHQRKKQI